MMSVNLGLKKPLRFFRISTSKTSMINLKRTALSPTKKRWRSICWTVLPNSAKHSASQLDHPRAITWLTTDTSDHFREPVSMSFVRLFICVVGVYSMFLLWAVAQERLSVPFKSVVDGSAEKFRSALVIGTCQSALSCISALCYILLRRKPGDTLLQSLGLRTASKPMENGVANGSASSHKNHHKRHHERRHKLDTRSLLLRYLHCSVLITSAAPLGFAALSYISYPAMVLGKSCKLVPVMIMNVLLYRRHFAAHKYLVVAMVTVGITMFMFFGHEKSSHSAKGPVGPSTSRRNMIGMAYLLANLALDGVINSTQDEVFSSYQVTGQQMMFWINLICTCLSTLLSVLPLPHIPAIHPSPSGQTELGVALAFIHTHPSVILPLFQFALTGALGQLFIYETLQHFGSLTLVTITLTRKMFTMLLSVIVYNHKLTSGQWLGAGVVFAGISVEAWVKAKGTRVKRIIQEKEKAKIKSL